MNTNPGETPEAGGTDCPQAEWPAALASHGRWLRTVALARTGEPQAVDEVMQNVAVAVMRAAGTPGEPESLAPWLYRVTVRQSLLYRRGLGRQRRLQSRYRERTIEQTGPDGRNGAAADPLAWLIADEQRRLIRSALARLPGRDAEALLLKYGEGWSYAEIAGHVGTTAKAVQSRLYRARERLRAELTSMGVVEAKP